MNIGIFFKHAPSGGGIFQYFLTIMECIKRSDNSDRFFLFYCHNFDEISDFKKFGIITVKLSVKSNDIDQRESDNQCYKAMHDGKPVYFKTRPYTDELKSECKKKCIDLMIYTNIERESFELGVPYITELLDWTHRTHPEFKEFTEDGIFEQREYVITNSVKKAISIICDSKVAKKEIIEFYDVDSDKIKVLPFVPPPYLDENISEILIEEAKEKLSLPDKYIFYPAQFWPHKNHENVIKALSLIKNKYDISIPVVLVGSTVNKWSNLDQIMNIAQTLDVQSQIYHLGYVDSKYMAPLYKLATALVIPTFPGPTNIPVLEAFVTGCPVITSNIEALREQVGDAGVLVDPSKSEEIAEAIYNLWTDSSKRDKLIKNGRLRIKNWNHLHFSKKFEEIFEESKNFFYYKRREYGLFERTSSKP